MSGRPSARIDPGECFLPASAQRWFIALLIYCGAATDPERPDHVVSTSRLVAAATAMDAFWRVTLGHCGSRPPEHVVSDPACAPWLERFDAVRAPAEYALRRVGAGLTIDELLELAPRESPGGLLIWTEGD